MSIFVVQLSFQILKYLLELFLSYPVLFQIIKSRNFWYDTHSWAVRWKLLKILAFMKSFSGIIFYSFKQSNGWFIIGKRQFKFMKIIQQHKACIAKILCKWSHLWKSFIIKYIAYCLDDVRIVVSKEELYFFFILLIWNKLIYDLKKIFLDLRIELPKSEVR